MCSSPPPTLLRTIPPPSHQTLQLCFAFFFCPPRLICATLISLNKSPQQLTTVNSSTGRGAICSGLGLPRFADAVSATVSSCVWLPCYVQKIMFPCSCLLPLAPSLFLFPLTQWSLSLERGQLYVYSRKGWAFCNLFSASWPILTCYYWLRSSSTISLRLFLLV